MGLTTTQYTADIFFEGSSIYFGYQANISYAISDKISAAIGGRLVTAKNKYKGHINDIMINPLHPLANPTAALISAPAFFTTIGQTAYAAMTSNTEADATMTGTGFTPVISVNVSPSENLNFALRYEFKTKLNLKTSVVEGKDAGMFIQDSVAIADLPAAISFGLNFRPVKKLMLSGSFSYYFDKGVDYDGQPKVEINMIDKNFIEFGLGAEYGISEKLRVSAGWAATATGVNDEYQSDMSYSTNTNSFGAGLGYRINDMIDINLGGQIAIYKEGTKSFTSSTTGLPIVETYGKSTWLVGVGANFYFGKK
jgi:long-subunit fatty acid transport protein